MYSKITGSIPARTDVDLTTQGFTDGQRNSAQNLKNAIGQNRVVLSLAHNMAQPNGITAAMIDVLTEYVAQQRHSRGRRTETTGRGGGERAVARAGLDASPTPSRKGGEKARRRGRARAKATPGAPRSPPSSPNSRSGRRC